MPSKVYQYYPVREGRLSCVVCEYPYALDAPLSTLKKHLRVKHDFSIRKPPKHQPRLASPSSATFQYCLPEPTFKRIDIQSMLNPITRNPAQTPIPWSSVFSTPAVIPPSRAMYDPSSESSHTSDSNYTFVNFHGKEWGSGCLSHQ